MNEVLYHFLKNYPKNDINDANKFLAFVKDFAFLIAEKMGIKQSFNIQWKYNQNLFILGSFDVKTKTIFFNLNRITALQKYKIKSATKGFSEFVEKFLVNYETVSQPDEADKSLYFTLKNKPKDILHLLGDYEQIPFDMATTVLHELRHLYQIEQAELGDPFFLFITKNDLRSVQKSFNPLCEPTEIDAIFFQLKVLREYCYLNNLKEVFEKSIHLSVPEFDEKDVENNIRFIGNNSKLYSTAENLSRLKTELVNIYNWKAQDGNK